MTKLLIKNANVVLNDAMLAGADVLLSNGKIEKIEKNIVVDDVAVLDAQGKTMMPGFIDVHTHGGMGVDFMNADAQGNTKVAEFFASKGTSSFLATTLTSSKESLMAALKAVGEAQELDYKGAEIIGVHMEGPFFNVKYKGAQNPKYISNAMISDIKDYMNVKPGLLKMMSLAPEKEGALEAIKFMTQNDIICSAGHSGATYCEVCAAVEKGLTHGTHTFNGMTPLHHREPGMVGAIMLEDKIYAEAIFDAIHLNPAIVKLLVKVKGIDKVILITDSMQAVGLEDGRYDLGGLEVDVEGGAARLLDGTLAGSCLTMEGALKNCVEYLELPLWDVAKMMSTNAAVHLGVNKGQIAVGYDADLVIVDELFSISNTIVAGVEVFAAK
ncbi:MAG TPA: N-acetylglucosamine-6-phosphate deacetylase [Psychromonas hadalis]|nr:N-acetylglucosamine-6-phosphate deacetylase [Psychromonas hadalis]